MTYVAYSPESRFSTPFQGVLPPSGPQISAESGSGHPPSRTRETCLASIVHLATILPRHASRSTPQQRGQVVRRPSPAGYCLPPTAKLAKIERGPISTSSPLCQYVTKPGDRSGKIETSR